MKKQYLAAVMLFVLLLMPNAQAEPRTIDLESMSRKEIEALIAEATEALLFFSDSIDDVNPQVAHDDEDESNAESSVEGVTLRQLFPCQDLAKAIRDNVGLASIDQPIPEGKLDSFKSITYAIYPDAKTAYVDDITGIGHLKNLQIVNLLYGMFPRYEAVSYLPDDFFTLTNVYQLCLSSTSIREIDPRLGDMTSLTYLDLSQLEIFAIPPELGNLNALKTLKLNNTKISELPKGIGDIASIEVLDLSGTAINVFPECILNMHNLRELYIADTRISELPEGIGSMTNLRVFDISRTQISSLPASTFSLNLDEFKKDGLNID